MELTNQLSASAADFPVGVQESSIQTHIKEWIDGNMYYADQNFVWRIGITTAENIVKIEALIRQDMQCKHWKYWRAGSFKDAMHTLSELGHYRFIFKSRHNEYLGKGLYLFTYKTIIDQKSLFYHTLHS
jgi:hypothetical protein